MTCAATMEVALRRRLEGVKSISISEAEETAEVTFDGTHPFSAEAFRQALRAASVDVVAFHVDACGAVQKAGEQAWLIAGSDRLLLDGAVTLDSPRICVSGRLEGSDGSYRLAVKEARAAAAGR